MEWNNIEGPGLRRVSAIDLTPWQKVVLERQGYTVTDYDRSVVPTALALAERNALVTRAIRAEFRLMSPILRKIREGLTKLRRKAKD